MDDFDRERDTDIERLMARIRPGWDAARTESNLVAILERLKGPSGWRRAWQAMLAATRSRYQTSDR
jgi:hypothetical protein